MNSILNKFKETSIAPYLFWTSRISSWTDLIAILDETVENFSLTSFRGLETSY